MVDAVGPAGTHVDDRLQQLGAGGLDVGDHRLDQRIPVREVVEHGPAGQARRLGDAGVGGRVIADLHEQPHGGVEDAGAGAQRLGTVGGGTRTRADADAFGIGLGLGLEVDLHVLIHTADAPYQ